MTLMDTHDCFDLAGHDEESAYALLAGLVTPRPIAWVTTVDATGRPNAAPFSFFNLMGAEPLIVALGIGDREDGTPKDTALNIAATGEFVVNLVDESVATAMNATSPPFPHGENELRVAGVTAAACRRVKAPRILEAPASLECRHAQTVRVGNNRVVFGEVLVVHARSGIVDPRTLTVDPEIFRPIGRLGGRGGYCRTTDRFEMPRPR